MNDEMANGKPDVKAMMREAMQEMLAQQRAEAEPAHKAELGEERRRREALEKRVNELVEESRRSRAMAEEVERHATIKGELQRLGVQKIDLAFRAVRDEIARGEDGRLVTRDGTADVREYLTQFVAENPELLPARVGGGAGTAAVSRAAPVDLDRIRPGMSEEERDRVRQEILKMTGR